MHLSLVDCEQERRLARKGYAHIKETTSASREGFLEGLAALQSSKGNETIS